MKTRLAKIRNVPGNSEISATILLALFFMAGGLLGCLTAARVGGGANDSLALYIRGYLAAGVAGEVSTPSIFSLIWDSFRYALIAALFGFTSLGVILMPLLMAVRGFFLAFAAASFVHMCGGGGLLLAMGVFGFSCLLTVPCLFVLAVQGYLAARVLAGMATDGRYPMYDNRAALRFLICFLVLSCNVLFSRFAAPPLLNWLASAWGAF
jgi:hypothetical protein